MSALLVVAALTSPLRAYGAIVPTVGLGTADSYSILAGEAITNTGPTTVDGDVGVSPGTAVGLTPAQVEGEIHSADGPALQAKADLTIAYDDAAGRTPNENLAVELGGQRLIGGVYKVTTEAQITGALTLDGEGNEDSVFIFQVPTALTTATASSVNLVNGASSCNVFWQVGSSATIGVGTDFVGTVMALASVAVETGATVQGRALARNGEVTLDSNVFTSTECAIGPTEAPPVTVTPTVTAPPITVTPTVTASPGVTVTPTITASPGVTVTPTVTASPGVTVTPTVTTTPVTGAPTDVDSESATDSPSTTGTGTATSTEGLATDSEQETENATATGTSTSETLASTGSSGTLSLVASVGAFIALLGGALLGVARLRAQPKHRH